MTLYPGVALIIGAASGIGRQCAISFAREGCSRIAILDKNKTDLDETLQLAEAAAFFKVDILSIAINVRNDDDVLRGIGQVIARFGRIDYAVNSAGIHGPSKSSHELKSATFDKIMEVNFRGLWLCARLELKYMVAQDVGETHDGRSGFKGSIVNVASNIHQFSEPYAPAYNASKAAILSLTKSDAVDYGEQGIRVNCVCPGVIDTPMTGDIPNDDPVVQRTAMKRKGTAQEVADAVLFLSSSKASFIQGAELVVDGGYIIA